MSEIDEADIDYLRGAARVPFSVDGVGARVLLALVGEVRGLRGRLAGMTQQQDSLQYLGERIARAEERISSINDNHMEIVQEVRAAQERIAALEAARPPHQVASAVQPSQVYRYSVSGPPEGMPQPVLPPSHVRDWQEEVTKLRLEVERLRTAVAQAFFEGFNAYMPSESPIGAWAVSAARRSIEGAPSAPTDDPKAAKEFGHEGRRS